MRLPSRIFAGVFAALLGCLCTFAVDAAGVVRLTRISLTVADLNRSKAFYRDGLGFKRVSEQTLSDPAFAHLYGVPHARIHALLMRLGDEEVEFDQFSPHGKSYPPRSRSEDRWFQHFAIVVSDMPRAYSHLKRVHFAAISHGGPQTLPPETGSVQAFKFRDPDGHPLELLYFPQGQGRAVWHPTQTNEIFLGIDHSAIGIASTARSVAFYTQLLGLKPAYHSLNEGLTQQALDGAFNATVQITGLRPPNAENTGIGIELLDYRAPSDGRAASAQTHSKDVVYAQLTFTVDDIDSLSKSLLDAEVPFISPRIVQLPGDGGRALIVRDPDGHAIELRQ
jgi:catechol 2,3-dioxygenase-like lactoylglutathione lyase family enzyme